MTRIYFVEDNPLLLNNGLLWLKNEGYEAHGATSVRELSTLMDNDTPDLIILDWNLPYEDGLSIATRLRGTPETEKILIIFVTSRNSIDDKLAGLGEADAYITKPFDYRELLATIRALLRRSNNQEITQEPNTWLLMPSRSLIRSPDNLELEITEKENIVIQLFIQHPNKIISPRMISEACHEDFSIFDKNRIEVLISRLRNKLKTGNENPIRSFRNRGYQLMIKVKISP
jgi:DNA-binding response OmpR family regulator